MTKRMIVDRNDPPPLLTPRQFKAFKAGGEAIQQAKAGAAFLIDQRALELVTFAKHFARAADALAAARAADALIVEKMPDPMARDLLDALAVPLPSLDEPSPTLQADVAALTAKLREVVSRQMSALDGSAS